MIAGQGLDLPPEVKAQGWKPGKKKGWKGLTKGHIVVYRAGSSRYVAVGYVLFNDKEQQQVHVHTCRSRWTGTAVTHVKEYRKSAAEGAESE